MISSAETAEALVRTVSKGYSITYHSGFLLAERRTVIKDKDGAVVMDMPREPVDSIARTMWRLAAAGYVVLVQKRWADNKGADYLAVRTAKRWRHA